MKFVMNGGLIIGTMDGANIEIREKCGEETMFIFGCLEDQIPDIKKRAQAGHYPIDSRMREVFDVIKQGKFSCGDMVANAEFVALIDTLCNITAAGTWDGDKYLLIQDFASYIDAQNRVDATYQDKAKWAKLSIEAAVSMAKFSTDRTMREYSSVIWGIEPSPRPLTMGGTLKSQTPEERKARTELSAMDKEVKALSSKARAKARELEEMEADMKRISEEVKAKTKQLEEMEKKKQVVAKEASAVKSELEAKTSALEEKKQSVMKN